VISPSQPLLKNIFKFFTLHKPRHIKVLAKIIKFKFSENLIHK